MELANIYPEKLLSLIAEIEQQKEMTSRLLVQILDSGNLKSDDFIKFSDFNHLPQYSYGRTKLFSGINFAIFLMSWAKYDFTAIHNHGQCDWGAVYFLGEVNHRGYQLNNDQVLLVDKGIVPKGTVVPVKGDLIHSMGNLSEQPSMSLHIYGLNNSLETHDTTTRIFELEKKRIRFTSGEAFIDGFESFGKPLKKIKTSEETLSDYLEIILPYYEKNKKTHMVKKIKSAIEDPAFYLSN